jgi:hypothetical protein
MGGPDDIQDVREILGDIVQAGLHASAVIDRVRSMVKNEQRGVPSLLISQTPYAMLSYFCIPTR